MSDLSSAMAAAAAGLRAQTMRMRIASENVANAESTGATAGADPYARRIPIFRAETLEDGAMGVKVVGAATDHSPFKTNFEPGNPAADANGFVKMPNVDMLTEMMDIREASRAYEANLTMIDNAREITSRALDLLRK